MTPTPEQRLTQRFGMDALTDLAHRRPDPSTRAEFAEACLLWDTPPGESWNTDPLVPRTMLTEPSAFE